MALIDARPISPFKKVCSGRSRGNEAHFPSGNGGRSEPPDVGCYVFNGLLSVTMNERQRRRKGGNLDGSA